MLDHGELQALIPGYALQILDAEERREFDAHLGSCDVCPPMIAELRAAANLLAMSAPEDEPAPALRSRILSAVHDADAPARSLPVNVAAIPRAPWWAVLFGRPALASAMAVLVLAVAGLGYWGYRLQSDLSTTQVRLARTYQAVQVMARADAKWQMGGSQFAPQSSALLSFSSQDNQSCLMVWDLPKVAGKTYVAWTVKDNQYAKVGRLIPFDNYYWRLIDGDVRVDDTVQITLEDSDQVQKPSSTRAQWVDLKKRTN